MSYILDALKEVSYEFKPVEVCDFLDYKPASLVDYKQTVAEVNEYLELLLEAQENEFFRMYNGRRLL